MTPDDFLRIASLIAWLVCLASLSPAVFRLVLGRGRHLDPIWTLVFLLAINRVSFLTRVSAEMSHATAILLAMAMSYFTIWYQRRDA